jgi:hypothetical protein
MEPSQRKSFLTSGLKRARTNKLPGTMPKLAIPIIPRIAGKTRRTVTPARFVTPAMLCRNQAGTGNAARAVGVAVKDAASWSASKARTRSSIASGEICQLCLVRSVPLGEESAERGGQSEVLSFPFAKKSPHRRFYRCGL